MTINITENFFAETIFEWRQLRGGFNWYTFTLINIYFEKDDFTGGYECEFILLGLGLRFRYNTARFYEKMKEWEVEDTV